MGRTELAQTLESENQQKIGRRRTEQVEEEEFRGKKVQKTFGSLKAYSKLIYYIKNLKY